MLHLRSLISGGAAFGGLSKRSSAVVARQYVQLFLHLSFSRELSISVFSITHGAAFLPMLLLERPFFSVSTTLAH